MPAIIPAVANELVSGVRDVIRQAAASATGNQGNYIADGQPESIYGRIQQETARQYCRRYGDNPSVYSGVAAVLVENACRPYLDDIGYPSGPTIELPASGGQCVDLYNVDGVVVTFDGNCGTVNNPIDLNGIPGPITGPFYDNTGSVGNAPPTCPNARGTLAFINDGGGNKIALAGSGAGVQSANVTFTLASGQPDNCGNQPPQIEPPRPNPNPEPPGPRPFFDPPDIDIEIDVEIGPDGDIIIDIGTGPITIDPFDEGGDGEPGGGPPPGDVGEPGDPVDIGPGGEGGDEAPEGQVLVGVRVELLTIPDSRNRYTDEVYRGAYYLYMGVPGLLDHDPAGAMATEDQFIFAEKDNLTAWRIRANKGYEVRATPYYREVE